MPIQKAQADLARMEDAADQMRRRLAELEARISKLRTFLEVAAEYGASIWDDTPSARVPAPAHIPATRSPSGIVASAQNAAAEILKNAMRPIPTKELLAEMLAMGVVIGGSQPTSNLSGMLSRSEVFKSTKEGWRLTEWDAPQTSPDRYHTDDDVGAQKTGLFGDPSDEAPAHAPDKWPSDS